MADYLFSTLSSLALAGAVGLSVNHLLKESIYLRLKREKLIPLSEGDGEGWEINASNPDNITHSKLGSKPNALDLQRGCSETLMMNYSEDKYSEAKKGCIKPPLNKDQIKGLRELGENEEAWDKKAEEYSYFFRFGDDISMEKDGKTVVLKSDINKSKLFIGCDNAKNKYFKRNNKIKLETIKKWCYV